MPGGQLHSPCRTKSSESTGSSRDVSSWIDVEVDMEVDVDVDVVVDVDVDVGADSASQTASAMRTSMMPPEEKLNYYHGRSQTLAGKQQFDACIQDLVRCVALARLVYGKRHFKVAQAHARLADGYLQYKGFGVQAQEHSSTARDLLPLHSLLSTGRDDRLQVLTCLLSVHLTAGGAALLTDNLKEAELSFLNAEKILEELHLKDGVVQEEKIKTELKISTSLSRVHQGQGKPAEALVQCERSLRLLEELGKVEETCCVYRDMAAIEQARGCLDQAIKLLSKAHAKAVSQSLGDLERARISHSLAMALSAAQQPRHNDSAAQYFEESLVAYRDALGPQDPAFLTAQDCHFLLLNGQKERCVEIQKSSLALKRSTFGGVSAEVVDGLQLIGGVEMTLGAIKAAYRTMSKCLEIQNILYGPKHKKTIATQKTVDMLARAPDIAKGQLRQRSGETSVPCSSITPDFKKYGYAP